MGCAVLAGGISAVLFLILSHTFQTLDQKSGLPPPSYLWVAISVIQPGAAVLAGVGMPESIMLFSYLTFSAYTDRYTSYLYTAVNWGYLSSGLVFLAVVGFQYQCFWEAVTALGLYLLWVLLCYLLHAIHAGDVELLAAAAAWILIAAIPVFPEGWKSNPLPLMSLLMAVYTAGSFLAFVCNVTAYRKAGKKRAAFAPYLLWGNCTVFLGACLYLSNIFH